MLVRSFRRPLTTRGLALLLAFFGGGALLHGFSLAVLEEARDRYGHVVTGVVTDRSSRGRVWQSHVVGYRYPCRSKSGSCYDREVVSEGLYATTRVGAQVRVRQAEGESTTARLDDNPQARVALLETAAACLLFGLARALRGGFTFGPKYAKARAIVTAVEQVRYGDDTRWKIRFAYFDAKGNPQESIDEVNDDSWRVNDDCIAVYRPQAPDLATLQPIMKQL